VVSPNRSGIGNPAAHIYDDALRFDSAANPILYLGLASPGSQESAAVWAIQRISVASGVQIEWAGGDDSRTNIWADRATLSYS
jgi:hypothetical protein